MKGGGFSLTVAGVVQITASEERGLGRGGSHGSRDYDLAAHVYGYGAYATS